MKTLLLGLMVLSSLSAIASEDCQITLNSNSYHTEKKNFSDIDQEKKVKILDWFQTALEKKGYDVTIAPFASKYLPDGNNKFVPNPVASKHIEFYNIYRDTHAIQNSTSIHMYDENGKQIFAESIAVGESVGIGGFAGLHLFSYGRTWTRTGLMKRILKDLPDCE